jgi:Ca2+/Na+ antiporter
LLRLRVGQVDGEQLVTRRTGTRAPSLLTHDTARRVLDAESLGLTYQQQQVLSFLSTAMGYSRRGGCMATRITYAFLAHLHMKRLRLWLCLMELCFFCLLDVFLCTTVSPSNKQHTTTNNKQHTTDNTQQTPNKQRNQQATHSKQETKTQNPKTGHRKRKTRSTKQGTTSKKQETRNKGQPARSKKQGTNDDGPQATRNTQQHLFYYVLSLLYFTLLYFT